LNFDSEWKSSRHLKSPTADVHLQLDSQAEVRDLDFDGSYVFTSVGNGAYQLKGYLAAADHSKISGTDVTVNFTVVGGADTSAPARPTRFRRR
jgi:hypothetical protein